MFQKNSNEALSTSTKICNVFIVNRIYLKLQKMVCQLPYRQVCFIWSYCWGWTNGLTLRTLFTDEGFWHWGHFSLMKVFDIEDTFHWWRVLTLRTLFTNEGFWHWGHFSQMKVFDICIYGYSEKDPSEFNFLKISPWMFFLELHLVTMLWSGVKRGYIKEDVNLTLKWNAAIRFQYWNTEIGRP